ncbi:hypothetical protein R1flu_027678 [Riccia fluitans]|uniref:Uncharacterized protein n=1 Tax=Riccia fluitans TaxID=41844 RepID=A0ABD1XJL6_9MARC
MNRGGGGELVGSISCIGNTRVLWSIWRAAVWSGRVHRILVEGDCVGSRGRIRGLIVWLGVGVGGNCIGAAPAKGCVSSGRAARVVRVSVNANPAYCTVEVLREARRLCLKYVAKSNRLQKLCSELMKVHRRQSLLAKMAHSGSPELLIGTQPSKQERHNQIKSRNGRRECPESRHPVASRTVQDGNLFAHPIYNEIFETSPSENTAVFHQRASVIAALVRNRNWRDGSQVFRPSDFRALDKKASNVSGDPFLDPSCSLFIDNDIFEREASIPNRRYGPVFTALPIPSSGVTLDPRKALAEAGWVKTHPNDPLKTAGGSARSKKTDDQLRRALQTSSHFRGGSERKGNDKVSTKSMASNTHDKRNGVRPRLLRSHDNFLKAHTKMHSSSPPQNPVEDVAKQVAVAPDLWLQGSGFDPATVWQQQAASVHSAEGSPAPPMDGSPPKNTMHSRSQSSEFDPPTAWQPQAASPAFQGDGSGSPASLLNDGSSEKAAHDLWSQDSHFDPAIAWQLQASGSYPSEDSPAPPQDISQGNQSQLSSSSDQGFGVYTEQPFGDGMSKDGPETVQQFGDGFGSVAGFGEQYAGCVQDAGVFTPQDPGCSGPQLPSKLVESQLGTLLSGVQVTFESYARMNFAAQPRGIWPLSIWKRVEFDVLLMYTKARQHPCAPVSSWQDPLGEPLLRTVPHRLRSEALAVFARNFNLFDGLYGRCSNDSK